MHKSVENIFSLKKIGLQSEKKKIVAPHEKGVVRRGLCVVVADVKSQCREKKVFSPRDKSGKAKDTRKREFDCGGGGGFGIAREREIRESGSPLFTHPKHEANAQIHLPKGD